MIEEISGYLETKLDEYITDLRTLSGIDSGPYDKEGANHVNDWLQHRFEQMGATVERHPFDAVGDAMIAHWYGSGTAKIALEGHTDTVFPKGTAAQRPLSFEDDKILGPGTCDMKAGLLLGIYAIEALQHIGFDDFGELTFLCLADEELDNRPSISLIRETLRGHDAVLGLEAARENGDIVTARKGGIVLWVTAHGRSAHAGVEPEKGRNAIMGMVRKLERVQALAQPENDITINVGTFQGGTMPNVVPDQAKVGIDVRSFNPLDLDNMCRQIKAVFDEPDAGNIHFTIESHENSPAMPRTPQTAQLEALTQQAAAELGFTVKGAKTGGAADAAYAAAEGVPALDGLGPIGGLDHGPDEYILKSSIVPRTALLTRLMMLICGEEHG